MCPAREDTVVKKTSAYWVEIAEYDLETARAMLQTGRYLYVGFMCHQVVEKMLKGYWQRVRSEMPPYTHNLKYLAEIGGIGQHMSSEQREFLNELVPMNIEARYPEKKDVLLRAMNEGICKRMLSRTEELQSWIKQKLSSEPDDTPT